MAGWNGLTGARGVAMPLIATGLIQAHVVDLTTALLLCLVPAVMGLAMYLDPPLPSELGSLRTRSRPSWLRWPGIRPGAEAVKASLPEQPAA